MEHKGFTVFNRAYAPATWTLSSTAKFLASRYLHTELRSQGGISEHAPMLAEILRRDGYYCAGFTAGGLLRTPGFDRGFHEYHWSMRSGQIEGSFPDAAKWLETNEEPFFLFLHTYEPHYPYTRTTFTHGLPRGRLGDLTQGERLLPADLFHYSVLSQEEQEYVSALYDGGIRTSADAVADLFALMDGLSLWENTVVIILSDHGEELFEHFGIFARHGHSLYNEVLRVPFMIYSPGNRGYRLVEDPVSLVDLVPTVADLLEIELSGPVDGTSLGPLLQGRSVERSVPILANMAHPFQGEGICLIQNDLKYMEINHRNTPETKQLLGEEWRPGITSWKDLFRVSGDPEEKDNLIESAPSLAATMQESLKAAVLRTLPPVTSTDFDEKASLRDDLAQQLILLGYVEE
jgi:arylsulfatase A-like enzyme